MAIQLSDALSGCQAYEMQQVFNQIGPEEERYIAPWFTSMIEPWRSIAIALGAVK